MVWGCFSLSGVGPLHQINGIMDSKMYKDIMETVMLPFAKKNMPKKWIYQQDNDPKHKSKLLTTFFKQKKIALLPWPSQSPDLNPIEHLWAELDTRTKGIKASNAAEKFDILSKEWEAIPKATLEKLIDSMPRRCQAVIDSLGYATKY